MSGAKAKRAPRCAKGCGRKAAADRGGKCMGCYLADYRAGVRLREDLGPDPQRLTFSVHREVYDRLKATGEDHAPLLRRALEAELQRMKEEV